MIFSRSQTLFGNAFLSAKRRTVTRHIATRSVALRHSQTEFGNEDKLILTRKVKAYFELGVRSCWLVNPEQGFISIYSTPNRGKPFSYKDAEAIDEVMNIRLPTQKVFYWFFE